MSINIASASAVSPLNLSGMDLDTAILAVQSQRASLVDKQLEAQINEVQQRNNLTAKLTEMQAKLNAIKAAFATDAKPTDTLASSDKYALASAYWDAAKDAGMNIAPLGTTEKDGKTVFVYPAKQDVEKVLTDLKSKIDALGNSQQMDMIRLQSLSNKRNEAYDLMTNFTKKMQDSRNSIIANMR